MYSIFNVLVYTTGSTQTSTLFVGNDYFCESGSSGRYDHTTFYTDRPWDGEQCMCMEQSREGVVVEPLVYHSSTKHYIHYHWYTSDYI